LWTYSGFGIETHDSAEYHYVAGQLQRSKKPQQVRGLNRNHNHDLKNLFKSAATNAVAKSGRLQEFYLALVKRGIRPEMARLTVARKLTFAGGFESHSPPHSQLTQLYVGVLLQ